MRVKSLFKFLFNNPKQDKFTTSVKGKTKVTWPYLNWAAGFPMH